MIGNIVHGESADVKTWVKIIAVHPLTILLNNLKSSAESLHDGDEVDSSWFSSGSLSFRNHLDCEELLDLISTDSLVTLVTWQRHTGHCVCVCVYARSPPPARSPASYTLGRADGPRMSSARRSRRRELRLQVERRKSGHSVIVRPRLCDHPPHAGKNGETVETEANTFGGFSPNRKYTRYTNNSDDSTSSVTNSEPNKEESNKTRHDCSDGMTSTAVYSLVPH